MAEVGGRLHLVPGDSAAGSVRQAFRAAGRGDEIAVLLDDLSCGPIERIEGTARNAWWRRFHDDMDAHDRSIATFWERVAAASGPVVVWVGLGAASEHCCLLAVAQALRGRSFGLVDVSRVGPQAAVEREWLGCLAHLQPEVLHALIGTEREVGPGEHAALAQHWATLQRENAPFRVVQAGKVASVPEDYFDQALLEQVADEPQRAARVVGGAMGHELTWMQVGDVMLRARLVALVAAGRLMADGDPWDLRACRVWLPG
jgi:hypothetical protein